mmetsp:Transcript_71796/g.99433  ORF Transcript_71796/g.99433 Transcript_71796/m.99433 type:complete len:81 (+) Transcript_71796:185-427(+)
MMENLDLSLQRSGKIEATLDRSDSLVGTAQIYRSTANKTKKTMYRRRMYMIIGGVLATLLCILLISMFACGFTFQRCRSS